MRLLYVYSCFINVIFVKINGLAESVRQFLHAKTYVNIEDTSFLHIFPIGLIFQTILLEPSELEMTLSGGGDCSPRPAPKPSLHHNMYYFARRSQKSQGNTHL